MSSAYLLRKWIFFFPEEDEPFSGSVNPVRSTFYLCCRTPTYFKPLPESSKFVSGFIHALK
jgi:hypothetical protein